MLMKHFDWSQLLSRIRLIHIVTRLSRLITYRIYILAKSKQRPQKHFKFYQVHKLFRNSCYEWTWSNLKWSMYLLHLNMPCKLDIACTLCMFNQCNFKMQIWFEENSTGKKKEITKKPLGRDNSIGSYEDIEGDDETTEGSFFKNLWRLRKRWQSLQRRELPLDPTWPAGCHSTESDFGFQ